MIFFCCQKLFLPDFVRAGQPFLRVSVEEEKKGRRFGLSDWADTILLPPALCWREREREKQLTDKPAAAAEPWGQWALAGMIPLFSLSLFFLFFFYSEKRKKKLEEGEKEAENENQALVSSCSSFLVSSVVSSVRAFGDRGACLYFSLGRKRDTLAHCDFANLYRHRDFSLGFWLLPKVHRKKKKEESSSGKCFSVPLLRNSVSWKCSKVKKDICSHNQIE